MTIDNIASRLRRMFASSWHLTLVDRMGYVLQSCMRPFCKIWGRVHAGARG